MPFETLSHTTHESLFLRIPRVNGSYFIIGVIYRLSGQVLEEFNNEYAEVVSLLSTKNKETYTLGDFNIDLLKFNNHAPRNNFLDTMSLHHFYQYSLNLQRVSVLHLQL